MGDSVVHLIGPNQIEKNRYYVKSLVKWSKFLVVNELPLSGNIESPETRKEDNVFAGLYLKLFEFLLLKDVKLRGIAHGIPQIAKYTLMCKMR